MIDNFRIIPAGHCGSGSMRNLIYHYCDVDLPEAVVFGLGAGIDSIFFTRPDNTGFTLFGRGVTMEADLARTLGIDYREQIQPDDDLAWEEVRAEVDAGRPTMLSGDILYLDYREYKVHFPAHRFVLLGYDDSRQEVYIADRINPTPETCSMGALRRSRNPKDAISTFNLWGKFHSGRIAHSLPSACERALRITVDRMLGRDQSQSELMQGNLAEGAELATGLAGLVLLSRHMRHWPQQSRPDHCARDLDNAIEKFGTGGACFRQHFADFLGWAALQRPDLISASSAVSAANAAGHWRNLSGLLQPLKLEGAGRASWHAVFDQMEQIVDTEQTLFKALDQCLATKAA
ncbi:MAG: BtrH N-terminal domain-containing protein [Pseudomonadota bacterium]